MALFNVVWRTQVTKLLPPDQRGSNLIDFLESLVIGLDTRAVEFLAFETDVRKRAVWSGQKIVLQAALNDILGIIIAPFIIVVPNQNTQFAQFFRNFSEPTSTKFSRNFSEISPTPIFLFNFSEISASGTDFTVEIPAVHHTQEVENQIEGEVKKIKLAGKLFNIVVT